MQDVDYYLKNYPAPVFCFTPDAEFRCATARRACSVPRSSAGVQRRHRGDRGRRGKQRRARPCKCAGQDRYLQAEECPNITLEPEGDGVRIRGWGKSGHAAMPQGTVNALVWW